ncbi:MAG: hypothetical protein FWG77_02640 [Treponema sp.]|nr:hypothetical protein [Treponema sp.]
MKAQFKYAFLNGIHLRGPAFAVILTVNLVFIILRSVDMLPFAALITGISLSGVGIAVMLVFNIISDVSMISGMFTAPGAYLMALTPVHRRKNLIANVTVMSLMDLITMGIVIVCTTFLAVNTAEFLGFSDIWGIIMMYIREDPTILRNGVYSILMLISGYLLTMSIILFCITARRSFLFTKPVPGLLTFLLGCLCFYAVSLSQLLLAPLGTVDRYTVFITISLGYDAIFPTYFLLLLLPAAGLFIVTSNLIEKRINI